ncbi:unnamed protein product [Rhizophagus irregularis]|nr:unnamed protein product [Rhizophagus irregularis]
MSHVHSLLSFHLKVTPSLIKKKNIEDHEKSFPTKRKQDYMKQWSFSFKISKFILINYFIKPFSFFLRQNVHFFLFQKLAY